MQSLPLADPDVPDLRSLLLRVVRLQRWTVLGGMLFGILWTSSQALVPCVPGRAIDSGIAERDPERLQREVLLLPGIAVVQGWSSITRHRFAVADWMLAAVRRASWQLDGAR